MGRLIFECSIYSKRPAICAEWPKEISDLNGFKWCSFSFIGKNQRVGQCNRCGICCYLQKDLHKDGVNFIKGWCKFLTVKVEDNKNG